MVDAGFVQQLLPQCPTPSTPTKAPAGATNCPTLEVGGRVYYEWASSSEVYGRQLKAISAYRELDRVLNILAEHIACLPSALVR